MMLMYIIDQQSSSQKAATPSTLQHTFIYQTHHHSTQSTNTPSSENHCPHSIVPPNNLKWNVDGVDISRIVWLRLWRSGGLPLWYVLE